jgi:MOSC domain-containing protein YiiM
MSLRSSTPVGTGRVIAIFLAPHAGSAPVGTPDVEAVKDAGLVGDRYALGTGSFSRWPGSGRAVTLIESEVLAAIQLEHALDLSAGRHRRNVVTAGIRLADLNGRRFRLGGAVLRGARLCAPCRYLDRLLGEPAYAPLKGRGGLRADVLEGGAFEVGDAIIPLGEQSRLP